MTQWKTEYLIESSEANEADTAFVVTITSVEQMQTEDPEQGMTQRITRGQVLVSKQELEEKGYKDTVSEYVRYWKEQGWYYEEGEKIYVRIC